MKAIARIMICLVIPMLLVGCGRKEQASSDRITVAVIPKGTMHEFWKSVHAGAVKASKELDCDIIWKGPTKEDDREAQVAVVEDMITKGVSAIALAPLDDAALRTPVSNASRSGIPVVIFDSGLQGEDYVSFVATDNYKGGQIAGEHMIKLLNGKGNVVLLRYSEGSDSTMKREQGFLDAVKKEKGIKLISSNQYGGVTPETAQKASENIFANLRNPDGSLPIDGIFCPNESTTFGMLLAIRSEGIAGKVKFIGFDGSQQLQDGLRKKQIDGLVLQNPMHMGYMAVKASVQNLKGEKVEKRIDTGATLVTPENMSKPEMMELLKPDLDKWLEE